MIPYNLVGYLKSGQHGEFPTDLFDKLLQVRTQEIHSHYVIVTLLPIPVQLRYAN